jgi:hypothetical protein
VKQPATLHYGGVDWATRTHAVLKANQGEAGSGPDRRPDRGRA